MRREAFPDTSGALLRALCRDPRNAEAWTRFVQTYGPRILRWARRWGLQDADAHDVTQMALMQFFRQVHAFQYDSTRRFRGWLRRLVHSSWCDFVDGYRDWHRGRGGSGVLKRLDSFAARDDLAEEIQKEHDRIILRLAMKRVEARV
jgi:RNA polymerase sigma-70 factor (ECF subfamily)